MKARRDIFQAVADPTRRAILVLLASQTFSAGAIADHFNSARSTVSRHIRILTDCGLVGAKSQGREIYYYLKIEQMNEMDLWVSQIKDTWEERFNNLDTYLEKLQNPPS